VDKPPLFASFLPDKLKAMNREYNFQEIEKKWQQQWAETSIFEVGDDLKGQEKQYVLVMFPYPSSDGLHVGHVEGYTAADIYARFLRMNGKIVLHPMGWDAFGLPAENYAIKKDKHPRETTEANINNFRRQIKSLGLSYDWSREVNTAQPDYYKWTQWLFLKLYEKGLAYRKKAKVNWCNSCQTVLANEQVTGGNCERCGNKVVQQDLEQWFFKVTDYADRLLEGLATIDWPEAIKTMQKNWIGKSTGVELTFPVADTQDEIKVFTTRPDTLMGATYVVLAPEHPLVNKITTNDCQSAVRKYQNETRTKTVLERTELNKAKTGVFTGVYAINPANKKKIPIWLADYVLMEYGTGAIMAVPAHDQRDFDFAQKYDLPIVEVISPDGRKHKLEEAYTADGQLINAGEFNGLTSEEAKSVIADKVHGQVKTIYRLRDWLVSRQRYWGAPIPIIHCDVCGIVPVPEKDLPVKLPEDVDFRPTGESPLARSQGFHQVACPRCGKKARRESDTMDTFVDSSWYFLRYADPRNEHKIFDQKLVSQWLPVDMCIGGAEHAVLHLLYSRFMTKFLHETGHLEFDEPFLKLRNQGLILGPDGQKMSKSRGNVISPDEIIDNYGADTLRLYEMFLGPLEQVKPWDTDSIEGSFRFVKKAYRLFSRQLEPKELQLATIKLLHEVTERLNNFHFNTAISAMMTYINEVQNNQATYGQEDGRVFASILSPFAPHLAEELWFCCGGEGLVSNTSWPSSKYKVPTVSIITLPVQVDGKVKATLTCARSEDETSVVERAVKLLSAQDKIKKGNIARYIYVKGKILNLVTK
jgi:leucyl-tRNA synthetase